MMKNKEFYDALVKADKWLQNLTKKLHERGNKFFTADALVYGCVRYYILRQQKIIDKIAMLTILEDMEFNVNHDGEVLLPYNPGESYTPDWLIRKYTANKRRFRRHDTFKFHVFDVYQNYAVDNRNIFSTLKYVNR